MLRFYQTQIISHTRSLGKPTHLITFWADLDMVMQEIIEKKKQEISQKKKLLLLLRVCCVLPLKDFLVH